MTTYFVKSEVRALLTGTATNTEYDELIDIEGPYADRDVENDLFAYSGVAPPYAGADLTADIKSAANWKTVQKVRGILRQNDGEKDASDRYMQIIGLNKNPDTQQVIIQGGIIGRLKATPSARSLIFFKTTGNVDSG